MKASGAHLVEARQSVTKLSQFLLPPFFGIAYVSNLHNAKREHRAADLPKLSNHCSTCSSQVPFLLAVSCLLQAVNVALFRSRLLLRSLPFHGCSGAPPVLRPAAMLTASISRAVSKACWRQQLFASRSRTCLLQAENFLTESALVTF